MLSIIHLLLVASFRNAVSLVPSCFFTQGRTRRYVKKNTLFAQKIVAKTKESFKLSDLYLLESILQSNIRGYDTTQLVSKDKSTGSYLLKMDRAMIENDSKTSPSCLDRLDWVAELLVSGESGKAFVNNLILKKLEFEKFSIDYTRVGNVPAPKDYNSKALLCRVSQCVSGEISLLSDDSIDHLLIVESDEGLHLCKQVHLSKIDKSKSIFDQRWKHRPFQYSSAMNISIAKVVIDILYDIAICSSDIEKDNITLLDPTCGSGTFLAYGLEKGFSVTGYDIKEKCVEGTCTNINFLFPDMDASDSVSKCDSSVQCIPSDQVVRHDTCVTNLPWGQNTEISNEECIRKILMNLHLSLKSNGYAVIVSKQNVDHDIYSCGFIKLGSASVPPRGFVLPGNKRKAKSTSDCTVSVVIKC